MKEPYSEESKQVSKYNDAVFSIIRLNDSWNLCKHYMRNGNFLLWKTELDSIYLELIPDLRRQTNTEELVGQNNLLLKKIALSKKRHELFFNLMQRHSFLRRLQDISGKAGVYSDENEEGFE